MNTVIQMNEAEFEAAFPLVPNHLNPYAAWPAEDEGCLFETYGEELEFVRSQASRNIWTLLDDGSGELLIVSGYHFVNRIGYFVSLKPAPPHLDFYCRISIFSEYL